MGIMILIQKAAILFLIAASMVSTLIMAAVFKWRAILPKSKSGKGVFSMVSFLRRLLHAHIGLCAQFLGVFVRDHRCVARRSRALDFERETLKIDIHLGVVFGDYDGF